MPLRRILVLSIAPGLLASAGPASPGAFDPGFDTGLRCEGGVNAVAHDAEARLIAVGGFSRFGGSASRGIVRLLANGKVDPSFKPGSGFDGPPKAVVVMDDGRILVGGDFKRFDDFDSPGLAMLQADGRRDRSFQSGFDAGTLAVGVACLEALPDGRVMVGGYFTRYARRDVGRYVLVRRDGRIDVSFKPGKGADSHVLGIHRLPDGRFLLGGFFREIDGHPSAAVARVQPDGKVDRGFSLDVGKSSAAYAVTSTGNGEPLAGGRFGIGDDTHHLLKLTPEGRVDDSFGGHGALDNNVCSLTVDDQGRLIVGGQFKRFGDTPMGGIGRLLADGRRDESFGFDETVSPSFTQPFPIDAEGRIVIYGWRPFPGRGLQAPVCRLLGREDPGPE